MLLRLVIFFTATLLSGAFVPRGPRTSTWTAVPRAKSPLVVHAVERTPFELEVPLGSDSRAQLKFKPLLDNSEVLVVKYPIPFGLSVEPKDGNAVVTADGLTYDRSAIEQWLSKGKTTSPLTGQPLPPNFPTS